MKRSTDSLPAYDFIKLSIIPEHRSRLHETIRSRFMDMLEQGLIQETRTFFERNDLSAKLPSMRSVGYRQVWAYLDQQLDYLGMVEHGVIATRQLAKRQLTWLRRIETTKQYIIDEQMPYSQILTDVRKAF
jgi:tRNA dimethylallyltransferase